MGTIGEKNRRIAIWKHNGSLTPANQPTPNGWELFKEKWARIRGETGFATIRAAASAGGITTPLDRYSFRIGFDKSIDVTMQIRQRDGSRLNIVAVRHDEAGREWTDIVGEIGGSDE